MSGGTSSTMKPIETHYAGCRFRSRLEARWAVFFDQLGIKWQYEPQGYEFDGERYLPDFWLPNAGQYVEVKGEDSRLHEAVQLLRKFRSSSAHDLVILGEIPEVDERLGRSPVHVLLNKVSDNVLFTASPVAGSPSGSLGFFFVPTLLTISIEALTTKSRFVNGIKPSKPIRDAYAAARSARFEHGESGAKQWSDGFGELNGQWDKPGELDL